MPVLGLKIGPSGITGVCAECRTEYVPSTDGLLGSILFPGGSFCSEECRDVYETRHVLEGHAVRAATIDNRMRRYEED